MKTNITAGDCLNKILQNKYPNEKFIPFCEAMIKGFYTTKLFSEDFIKERATAHNVSIQEYIDKLRDFLEFLNAVKKYDEVVLWFGNEPFCNANKKIVLQALKEYNYQGKIFLNTVIEETGELIKRELIQL